MPTLVITVTPNPFDPPGPFTIQVSGGTPPYSFTPAPSPPNPAGVVVSPASSGGSTSVSVPASTPPGATVQVAIRDSASPPNTGTASAQTA